MRDSLRAKDVLTFQEAPRKAGDPPPIPLRCKCGRVVGELSGVIGSGYYEIKHKCKGCGGWAVFTVRDGAIFWTRTEPAQRRQWPG